MPDSARRIALILALVVVVLAAVGIYSYSTRSSTSNVSAVVAAWSPNHKDFCAGAVALTQAQNSDKMTAKSEARSLHAFEALSIHAPTRIVHQQIGAVTVAFDNLITNPVALKAMESNVESSNPEVKAYLKAAKPLEASAGPASVAVASCTGGNLFTANTDSAVAAADATYYTVVSSDTTGAPTPVTIAEYASQFKSQSAGTVTPDGADARFNFSSGPPVCVTMPNSSQASPTAIACPPTN
jgi:hypothetical protein